MSENAIDVSNLSAVQISRIKEQGYHSDYSKEEICRHAVGNRFAYQMCTLLFTTGIVLTNIPILLVAALIAALTVLLPRHPFDYLYNLTLRYWLNRPKLPPRSPQAKFACGMATICLGIIIYLFYESLFFWGYLLGGILFVIAILVSTIDLCIPSKIYNALFQSRKAS